MKIDIFFTLARALTILSRPLLLLFIISQENLKIPSEKIALFFTISATLFQFLNCDSHRNYFKEYFNKKKRGLNISFIYKQYIDFLIGISFVLFFPIFIINVYIFKSIIISFGFTFMIIFEKNADEFLRFNLYKKDFRRWSFFSILMHPLPVLMTIIFFYFFQINILKIYTLCSVISYLSLLIYHYQNILIIDSSLFKKVKNTIRIYFQRALYTTLNIASGHTLIITRYLILFTDKDFFPLYVLLMSVVSGIPTIVDMFYTTYRRKNFVFNSLEAFEIVKNKKFLKILFFGFSACLCSSILLLWYKELLLFKSIQLSAIINMIAVLYTINLIFYESLYWQKKIIYRLYVEVSFYTSILFLMFLNSFFSFNILEILIFVLIIKLIRIFLTQMFLKTKLTINEDPLR